MNFKKGGSFTGDFEKDELKLGVLKDHKGNTFQNLDYPEHDNTALNGYFKNGKLFNYVRSYWFNE